MTEDNKSKSIKNNKYVYYMYSFISLTPLLKGKTEF